MSDFFTGCKEIGEDDMRRSGWVRPQRWLCGTSGRIGSGARPIFSHLCLKRRPGNAKPCGCAGAVVWILRKRLTDRIAPIVNGAARVRH